MKKALAKNLQVLSQQIAWLEELSENSTAGAVDVEVESLGRSVM